MTGACGPYNLGGSATVVVSLVRAGSQIEKQKLGIIISKIIKQLKLVKYIILNHISIRKG